MQAHEIHDALHSFRHDYPGTLPHMNIDSSAIDDLVTRVDARLPRERPRLIGFIASGTGEGTSTISSGYASSLARRTPGHVLLLKTNGDAQTGLVQGLATAQPLDSLVERRPDGVFVATLGSETAGSLWQQVADADFWRTLYERFDDIAIDLPSPAASQLGMAIAPRCHGVVVVLEAEKTRAPVAAHLVSSLRAVRANLLGTVLNKRRFHLPERVYRWL